MPTGVYQRTDKNLEGIRLFNKTKVGKKRPSFSVMWRENIGKYWKGKKKKPFSESHKNNMSLAAKKRGVKTGILSPHWKGGITEINKKERGSLLYNEWRREVFRRDNWTCQKYGLYGVKLHAHHIYNFSDYPSLRFDASNGVTLSDKAHKEFHKKYGKKNNTKEQLLSFLSIND